MFPAHEKGHRGEGIDNLASISSHTMHWKAENHPDTYRFDEEDSYQG